ncbi:MAG: LCP family protein [Candidatus Saccharimonadales bacterium]
MNDFRNKQFGKNKPSRNSIDGFRQPRPGANRTPLANGPNHRQIGDFSARGGLTPANQNRTVQAPALQPKPSFADEPLLIAKKTSKIGRRGFLGIGRRDATGKKVKMSRRRRVTLTVVAILTLLLLTVGFLAFKGYININKVLKGGGGAAALESNVDPSKLRGEGDGRVNILLLGRGGEGHEAPDLTDTVIVASIDPIAKEASLVSLPRDLYVPVGGGNGSMKLNAVYVTGKNAALAKTSRQKQTDEIKKQADEAGFSLLEQTIEKNLGVPIHYREIIDFTGFKQAVDTVGGVTVNVPSSVTENMRIDGKNYKLDVKPGVQQMDGFKALAYTRSRHTSARGDFDRSERQRSIIIALKAKVLSAGTFSNPAKISGLLDTLGDRVQTNFTIQDLTRIYQLGNEIDQSKITSIGLSDPPNNFVTTDNIGGQSVVVPRSGVGNFNEIKGYLRNQLKDSFIRDENASIAVLNGTSKSGLATQKADELKSFGYNITAVDNAPTRSYTKTTIVDLRGGAKKYTKNYLEKRFDVNVTSTLPDATIVPGTADFVIILGSDQSEAQR